MYEKKIQIKSYYNSHRNYLIKRILIWQQIKV
jgi:hypothetical protein